MKRRIARLALNLKSGLVRLPVHQPLAFNAFDRGKGAVDVAVAERHAVIVAVVELGKIPMQMLLFAMLIHAAHSALEDREVAFCRIGVNVIADVFASGMFDGFVAANNLPISG